MELLVVTMHSRGAVLSHEKCSPAPNSMSNGLKFRRSVRDAIAHLVVGRRSVTFNFTRSYGNFLFSYELQVAVTYLFIFVNKSTANGPPRTGHKNLVSNFQRLTLRIAAGRPFPLFRSGPGWPSSYCCAYTAGHSDA